MLDRHWFTPKEREAYRRRTELEHEATKLLKAADHRRPGTRERPAPKTVPDATSTMPRRYTLAAKTGTGAMRHREILRTKEPKECGKRELHALFTRLATLIEEHADDGDDFIDIEIEPIIERFIDDYYCDVEPGHIMIYLLVWFMLWRASRGQWAMPSAA